MTRAPARRGSALDREHAAPHRIVLTTAWFGDLACERCGTGLTTDSPHSIGYSLTDHFLDEPGQFWQERRILVCEACRGDEAYAAERLERRRGVQRGSLPTWGNTVARRRR